MIRTEIVAAHSHAHAIEIEIEIETESEASILAAEGPVRAIGEDVRDPRIRRGILTVTRGDLVQGMAGIKTETGRGGENGSLETGRIEINCETRIGKGITPKRRAGILRWIRPAGREKARINRWASKAKDPSFRQKQGEGPPCRKIPIRRREERWWK